MISEQDPQLAAKIAELDEVTTQIFRDTGSHNRMERLIEELHRTDIELVTLLIKEVWSGCDNIYAYSRLIVELITDPISQGFDDRWLIHTQKELDWINGLQDPIRVYRGCDISKTDGLSWTTDWETAKSFAGGHRGISYHRPVVVTGDVHKEDILFACLDREEHELVIEFESIINPVVRYLGHDQKQSTLAKIREKEARESEEFKAFLDSKNENFSHFTSDSIDLNSATLPEQ